MISSFDVASSSPSVFSSFPDNLLSHLFSFLDMVLSAWAQRPPASLLSDAVPTSDTGRVSSPGLDRDGLGSSTTKPGAGTTGLSSDPGAATPGTRRRGGRAALLRRAGRATLLCRADRAALLRCGDRTVLLRFGDRAAFLRRGDRAVFLRRGDCAVFLRRGDRAALRRRDDRAASDAGSLAPVSVIVSLAIGGKLGGCIPSNSRKWSRFRILVSFPSAFDCDMALGQSPGSSVTLKAQVVGN